MKRIILFLAFTFSLAACKAQQQVYPLNTFYKDAPDHSYMKDLDNYLPPYVGTYKATYQGDEITLYITKEDHLLINTSGVRKYYQDVLHVKYTIKKVSTGLTLQDNLNPPNPNRNEIISMGTNENDNHSISLYYSGTNCGVGWGRITLKKINATQISWSYYPNSSLFSGGDCPGNQDTKVYLPDTENLVFTKQ